jgi:hypothetical protein
VQSPDNWLNYNRYSYCLNNPLKYTDPSGEFIAPLVAAFLAQTACAAITSLGYASIAFHEGGDFSSAFAGAFIPGVVSSLASMVVPIGIGNAFGHQAGSFSFFHEVLRAGAHGLGGGLISSIKGGDFLSGALAGFASSAVGSAIQGSVSDGQLIFMAGVAGGLAGGLEFENGRLGWDWANAAEGFSIGSSVAAYNHGDIMLPEVVVYPGNADTDFLKEMFYAVPVIGSYAQYVNYFRKGNYSEAYKYLALGTFELVTFGVGSEYIKGTQVVSRVAAMEGSATVFRAVDATEAGIIKSTGKFTLQEGGLEVKYFAKNLEDAHWYGQRLYPNGYSVIQGTVKGTVNASDYWFPHIDIGAYVFPSETLPYIIPH